MAPSCNESVKSVLSDVCHFVNVTLKNEQLSKRAEAERTKLCESLEKLFAENYSLAPTADEGSTSSHKCPSVTGSFDESKASSHGSEDDYDDHITPSNVKSLENPTKLGYLDYKKDHGLLSAWQKKRYFVLHKQIMYCFKKPSDQRQASAFVVTGYEFRETGQTNAKKKECLFELVCPGKKSHQFRSDSREDLQGWEAALQKALTASSVEEGVEEDLYEPLPEESTDAGKTASSISSQSQSVATSQPTATSDQQEVYDEEDTEEFYTDAESAAASVTTGLSSSSSTNIMSTSTTSITTAAAANTQTSPPNSGKTGGGFFTKITGLLKKKDPLSSSLNTQEVASSSKGDQEGEIDEYADEEEIYEEVAQEEKQPSPAHKTITISPPSSPQTTSNKSPPPPLPSSPTPQPTTLTSVTQPPSNIPKVPTRLPPPPTSPALPPPRGPPPLPERGELPPRPPNMPVPPIPTSAKPQPQPTPHHPLRPTLEKSLHQQPRDQDFENLYLGAWPCQGSSDSELTFDRGDLIHVISRDLEPMSWWVGELAGKIGLVPKSFLVPAFVEVS